MAVAKICGIETEYGIVMRGVEESNPISSSSLLINSYVSSLGTSNVGWDFQDESPGRDARGDSLLLTAAPEIETHLVNAVLTNGARFYVDHAHPEYSSPECSNAREALVHDRAGEEILIRAMRSANAILPPGQEIVVYKNNSDGKGNSSSPRMCSQIGMPAPSSRVWAGRARVRVSSILWESIPTRAAPASTRKAAAASVRKGWSSK